MLRNVLLALLLAGCAAEGTPRFHATALESPAPAPDFALTSHAGTPAKLSDFQGRPVLLFFGFTHCPDVCPLTLTRLGRVLESLGSRGERVQILLVTVDPDRDTPAALADYVRKFGPQVTGFTGPADALARVRADYGAHTQRGGGMHPGISHSDAVYGIDREGKLRVVIAPDAPEEQIRDDVRTLLRL